MSEVKHSPLPWSFTRSNPAEGPDVIWITSPGDGSNRETEIGTLTGGKKGEANAALLKQALNSQARLVECLEALLPWADGALRKARHAAMKQHVRLEEVPDVKAGTDAVEQARTLIKEHSHDEG